MKNVKIVVATLLLAAGVVTLSSFVAKNFKKDAFAVVCVYYNIPSPNTANKDVVGSNRNLVESQFKTTSNWSVSAPAPDPSLGDCSDGEFLCSICFDNAQYTLAQALNIAWNYYTTNGTLPHDGDVDPGVNIIETFRQEGTSNH